MTPWGVNGKLKVKLETDFPHRFAPGAEVYIDQQLMTIEDAEWHGGKLAIKLNTINSAKEAQKFQGKTIEIPQSLVQPLPEGQFYHFQ